MRPHPWSCCSYDGCGSASSRSRCGDSGSSCSGCGSSKSDVLEASHVPIDSVHLELDELSVQSCEGNILGLHWVRVYCRVHNSVRYLGPCPGGRVRRPQAELLSSTIVCCPPPGVLHCHTIDIGHTTEVKDYVVGHHTKPEAVWTSAAVHRVSEHAVCRVHSVVLAAEVGRDAQRDCALALPLSSFS